MPGVWFTTATSPFSPRENSLQAIRRAYLENAVERNPTPEIVVAYWKEAEGDPRSKVFNLPREMVLKIPEYRDVMMNELRSAAPLYPAGVFAWASSIDKKEHPEVLQLALDHLAEWWKKSDDGGFAGSIHKLVVQDGASKETVAKIYSDLESVTESPKLGAGQLSDVVEVVHSLESTKAGKDYLAGHPSLGKKLAQAYMRQPRTIVVFPNSPAILDEWVKNLPPPEKFGEVLREERIPDWVLVTVEKDSRAFRKALDYYLAVDEYERRRLGDAIKRRMEKDPEVARLVTMSENPEIQALAKGKDAN